MYQIVSVIVLFMSFANSITARQYNEAICNGTIMLALVSQESKVNSISGIPDAISISSTDYTISNPPASTDTPSPKFITSAIHPISGVIYVILSVHNEDSDPEKRYFGILDTINDEVNILYPAIGEGNSQPSYNSMTFDCAADLFVIETYGRDIYKIDFDDNNVTDVTLYEDGESKSVCAPVQDCSESHAFHWEDEKLYRISSSTTGANKLFVRNDDGTETEFNITDSDNLCAGANILEMEYVGNDLFLISCQGINGIRFLDTSDIDNSGSAIISIGDNGAINSPNGQSEAHSAMITYDTNNMICKAPTSCTISPTLSPTRAPINVNNICENKCDAFNIRVDDYEYGGINNNDYICINYTVSRLSDDYPLCYKSIKYLVLGLCDGDNNNNHIDADDLNGIIHGLDIINHDTNRRVLGSDDSSDNNGFRYVWGTRNGIRINIPIENELKFTLCLKNIFEDNPVEFSNIVGLKRGRERFVCNRFDGLPCIDESKYNSGDYDSSGYNVRYKKYNKGGNKRKNRYSESGESAMVRQQLTNNDQWTVLSETDPLIRWTLISIFVVFAILLIFAIYVCVCRKCKKNDQNHKEDELGTVVRQNPNNMQMYDNDIEHVSDNQTVTEKTEKNI